MTIFSIRHLNWNVFNSIKYILYIVLFIFSWFPSQTAAGPTNWNLTSYQKKITEIHCVSYRTMVNQTTHTQLPVYELNLPEPHFVSTTEVGVCAWLKFQYFSETHGFVCVTELHLHLRGHKTVINTAEEHLQSSWLPFLCSSISVEGQQRYCYVYEIIQNNLVSSTACNNLFFFVLFQWII